MDKISGLASKLGGKGDSNQQQSSNNQQEDYVDKGLDTAEKKVGGNNVDTNKLRGTNEKITDTGRDEFEKKTGKHVPEKVSN